jgi:hypothetical protein
MRIPCIKCGTEILEATARANNGLCALCTRGGGYCKICGTRVWYSNKLGENICMDCMLKRRDKEIVTASGISWSCADEIDWQIFSTGITSAVQNCFARIAASNSSRSIKEVVVAYRVGEGFRIEPCITFADGEYINVAQNEEQLSDDLEPFDAAISRIMNSLEETECFTDIEMLESQVRIMMQEVFDSLKINDFGLDLAEGYTTSLKEF